MSSVRVLLADDHELVRAGIRSLLQAISGVMVVAEARDGREALESVRRHQPDVVLMDIGMPGLNGLEATSRIVKEFPRTQVIVLSMYKSEEYVLGALRNGAAGYLLKDASPTELQTAVRAVARGESYLSPSVSRQVIDDYRQRTAASTNPLDLLTPRQREILQLIAEGRSTKEIAGLLSVSVKTVETHRAQLMERLDVYDVPGLVRFAIRTGVTTPDH
jgi:DNA-binding NarL/FixJ family response regulator